jgi:hypothetical protein
MALQIGPDDASAGMAKDIYDAMDQAMKPGVPPDSLEDARKGWRKLAFAIASGVVNHIVQNMEVAGIQAQGNVTVAVSGGTGTGTVNTTQSGSRTGHVS